MEGIGLDNMLGAEQIEKLFSDQETGNPVETGGEEQKAELEPSPEEKNSDTEQTAEVDFSDLLGNPSESVGSGEQKGYGETPESKSSGTPQANLFSSIAKALKDEGVFPDLSDDDLQNVKDAASLKKMFDDEVSKSLDERQRMLEKAIHGGANSQELQVYQNAMNLSQTLGSKEAYDLLLKDGDDGEDFRKKVMYQDYINRGFPHERAVKMVQKSLDGGSDIEDAKDAFNSVREFYKKQVEDFENELEQRKQEQKANEEKQYSSLKKQILDTDSFYGGVKVDKAVRQKAYDALTKPVYKDEEGNYLTSLQKYQREHPLEFMINMAMMMTLTDNFKNVEKLTKTKIKEGVKKGFDEVISVLNTTRRNGDGTLNLANDAPDLSGRENWTLA